jgi:hypothetical protein
MDWANLHHHCPYTCKTYEMDPVSLSILDTTTLYGSSHRRYLIQHICMSCLIIGQSWRFTITIINTNKNNTIVLEHLFTNKEPLHPFLNKHVMFCDLFQPWLFNRNITYHWKSLSFDIFSIRPLIKIICNHWFWYQLIQMKAKDNMICYKLKPLKTKNNITIKRHPKYSNFFHPNLIWQKAITTLI